MSKTGELITTLDDLITVGQRLVACGEDLVRIATQVKESTSGEEKAPKGTGKPGKSAKEPEPEPAPEAPAPKAYTKEEVRALLAELSLAGFREEAKALVRKYSDGGSLTDIDPARYPELVGEAKKYHA